jgi:hypothetical protein
VRIQPLKAGAASADRRCIFSSRDNARFHESDTGQPDAAGRRVIARSLTMSYSVITRSFTTTGFLPGSLAPAPRYPGNGGEHEEGEEGKRADSKSM